MQTEEGWVHLLSERLSEHAPDWEVSNQSVSGDTTDQGLHRIKWLLPDVKPLLVIVELGGNDGLRGYPIELIRRKLLEIIDLTKKSGATPILAGMQMPPNYGPLYTEQFRDMYISIAQSENIPLIPFILEDVALNPDLMQDDGIHPNAEGQKQLLENVWSVLKKLLSDTQSEEI